MRIRSSGPTVSEPAMINDDSYHPTRRGFLGAAGLSVAGLLTWGWPGSSQAARFAVTRSPADWRKRLGPQRYHILREGGTERAFTSPLNKEHRRGTFVCAGCALPLFASATKFDSGTGWPSFYRPLKGAVVDQVRPHPRHGPDRGAVRPLRRSSRPCLRRRPAADRPALLHEWTGAEFPARLTPHLLRTRRRHSLPPAKGDSQWPFSITGLRARSASPPRFRSCSSPPRRLRPSPAFGRSKSARSGTRWMPSENARTPRARPGELGPATGGRRAPGCRSATFPERGGGGGGGGRDGWVDAGPIWNQIDADRKCPQVAKSAGGKWTGQWKTTRPGQMSVCQIKR